MKVHFREILGSNGRPALACSLILDDGSAFHASVPVAESIGKNEVPERRDDDPSRYFGRGYIDSIQIVTPIIQKAIENINPENQSKIDETLITLMQEKNIGSNFSLATSIACAKARASLRNVPLYKSFDNDDITSCPNIMVNLVNGGVHGDNKLDCQEFMVTPIDQSSVCQHIRYTSEIFHNLGNILEKNMQRRVLGSEGGYAPNINSTQEMLSLILKAAEDYKVKIALDFDATAFYARSFYFFDQKKFTKDDFYNYLIDLSFDFPILSMEDPLDENDWDSWKKLTKEIGKDVLILGDKIFATNQDLLTKGIEQGVGNGIVIKPNQIGTVTQSINVINIAKKANYKVVVSHRSGETNDSFIVDFGVGMKADYIKLGGMMRGEFTSKYNRLLEIDYALSH